MSGRYGRPDCEHDWVARLDGYEEQCGPTICSKCGAFGCYCDVPRKKDGTHIKPLEQFRKEGLNSTDDNGSWINPYVKLKKGDLRSVLKEEANK